MRCAMKLEASRVSHLQRGDLLRTHGWIGRRISDGLVIPLINVDDGPPDNASGGFRMNMHRESKGTDIRVVLHEFNFLDEQRRRFDGLTFGSHQATGIDIDINPALEQTSPLLVRL